MTYFYYPVGKTNHIDLQMQLANIEQALLHEFKIKDELKTPGEHICTPDTLDAITTTIYRHTEQAGVHPRTAAALCSLATTLTQLTQQYVLARENNARSIREDIEYKTKLVRTIASTADERVPLPTTEELEELLRLSPKYCHGSVVISVDRHHDNIASGVYINWELKDLVMTPNENPYWNINNGNPVDIPLAPIRVSVRLDQGSVYIQSTDMIKSQFHATGAAHPHIMGDRKPCFGDYEFPVFSCLESGDIAALNLVLVAYLSHANSDDGAGRYWPDWLIPQLSLNFTAKDYTQELNREDIEEDDENGLRIFRCTTLAGYLIPIYTAQQEIQYRRLFMKIERTFSEDDDGDCEEIDTHACVYPADELLNNLPNRNRYEESDGFKWMFNDNYPLLTEIPENTSFNAIAYQRRTGGLLDAANTKMTYPR